MVIWEKDKTYIEYLQKRIMEAKLIVRQIHQIIWEMFISGVKYNVYGHQDITFRLMKHLHQKREGYCANEYHS